MADLDRIIEVNIFRETSSLAKASFGLPLILSTFETSKTTPAFDRYREYGSLTEMTDEGWTVNDDVYKIAQVVWSQNPKVPLIAVGRQASNENEATALAAIAAVNNNWYGLLAATTIQASVTFDVDFVADNSILATINDIVCDPVIYSADQQTTMGLLKAEIESKVTGATVTIGATPFRTLTITMANGSITTGSIITTLGVTRPTATFVFTDENDVLAIAGWAEANDKLYSAISYSPEIINSGSTTDMASQLKALSYARTFLNYHPTVGQRLDAGIMGKMFPDTPGRGTWCYKNIAGVASYDLASGNKNTLLTKKCNMYTNIAGTGRYEQGTVAVGEYIDIIWGLDYLKSEIQSELFSLLANVSDKIPFTDSGIAAIVGVIKGVLFRFAGDSYKLLQADSIQISAPLYADISMGNKATRTLPDIEWEALLQGAIHFVKVRGVVSL